MTGDIFIKSRTPHRGHLTKLNVISSIHPPNQEVLEYPEKNASILHIQKLYQDGPANNTRDDFVALAQFDLGDTYFYSR